MGILTDFVIKKDTKHKWIREAILWIKELGVLAIFLMLALSHRIAWEEGYDTCAKQSCLVCWYGANSTNSTNRNITKEIIEKFNVTNTTIIEALNQ
jgi:hypothetical protein